MFIYLGRMALLVTLFLVLVNIFNSVTGNAPKSEGLTAVETWVIMCILHVFCVLLEYAFILKIIQVEKLRAAAGLSKVPKSKSLKKSRRGGTPNPEISSMQTTQSENENQYFFKNNMNQNLNGTDAPVTSGNFRYLNYYCNLYVCLYIRSP